MNTRALDTSSADTRYVLDRPIVLAGVGLSCGTSLYLVTVFGWRQGALFLVGVGAGLVLYHAAFGFTSAWRNVVTSGRGAGLRAQMLMMAVTAAVFLPLLADGQVWGIELRGAVRPLNLSVLVGAFIFGVGMQLGGGCASGTLFTAGGGSVRMIVTLAAFIVGSVLGAFNLPTWQQAPGLEPISLLVEFGLVGAISISFALLALVYLGSVFIERRRHGNLSGRATDTSRRAWLQGPWPLLAGAIGLAAVNIATLMLAGRPWGVTSGFALWGSKLISTVGVDAAAWPYWQSRTEALEASVFNDITSVMNFGIILGALTAAGLAGRFSPVWRVPARPLLAAVIGGLLLGYGARIAYGCNIGAYFSGVASSSVHAWAWFIAAFVGSTMGTRLRPFFQLGK